MAPSIEVSYPAAAASDLLSSTNLPKSTINLEILEIPPETDHDDSSSSSDLTLDHDPLATERSRLRQHLGLDSAHSPQTQPLFFVERVPDTNTASVSCNLPGCTAGINPGALRLALNPGMGGEAWFRSSSDYYHISCFERLADFTQSAYLNRLVPLTRNTFKLRGLKASSVSDGSYLLPGGVERLILEWKVRRGMEIDKRDGVFNPSYYELDPSVRALLYEAGSRGYWPTGRPAGLDMFEYYTLARTVAVNEVGKGNEEWNLFDAFLDDKDECGGRHDLSEMLGRWDRGMVLASAAEKKDLEAQDVLSTIAIRAIKRLSTVPVPQVGYNRIWS
ncbi:uncharacterized protein DSM5745_08581 [Aspergillus mulundensis]|uniref:Uncharacterized protein n=1 Tax=Aspergillus mulundensis TaxID=1810919 RepID=A0A3D8R4G5_9EURO|nr:Uncharacterized protein DSM5745_08581 [Aspergillus mulundensis]RDW68821.1 Uncharacterized protein DSM5745_08581 [Aspergillus mulundensis]